MAISDKAWTISKKFIPAQRQRGVISQDGQFEFEKIARTASMRNLIGMYCNDAYGYDKSDRQDVSDFINGGVAKGGEILFFTEEDAKSLIAKGDKCTLDDIGFARGVRSDSGDAIALELKSNKISEQESEISKLKAELAKVKKATSAASKTKPKTETKS